MSICVFTAASLFIFMAAESYYRWIADSTDSFALSKTTEKWFERHYQLNNLGFRDEGGYMKESRPGKKRVMFLGDSFTAGHGIKDPQQRFANLIREKEKDWDIHIFARNGWDTGAEIEVLKKSFALGYKPGLVVLVYVLNDVSDILPEWNQILQRIYQNEENQNFWIKHSFFINRLYFRWRAAQRSEIRDYYAFVKKGYERSLWKVQQFRLKELKQLVEDSGGRFAVVTFPFVHALKENKVYDYEMIHQKLSNFWQDLEVPHLDLYPTYKKYSSKQLYLNRYDAHPNVFANRIAAEVIEPFIASLLNAND